MRNAKDLWMRNKKRYMAHDITKTTLQKILEAPVNLFFDVTPIGKILDIFNGDMNVFRGEILDGFSHCMHMISHVIVVITMILRIGSWEVLVGFSVMMLLSYKISTPYMHADNQLHKVGSTLWGPIHSYFHETMRGTNIIRAFDQEKTIMAKQHEMLDKTT